MEKEYNHALTIHAKAGRWVGVKMDHLSDMIPM